MKKKAIVRISALAVMSVVFCSFTLSGAKPTKKAMPLYHTVDCTYIDIGNGQNRPGIKCVYGEGISCMATTECEPKSDTGPR